MVAAVAGADWDFGRWYGACPRTSAAHTPNVNRLTQIFALILRCILRCLALASPATVGRPWRAHEAWMAVSAEDTDIQESRRRCLQSMYRCLSYESRKPPDGPEISHFPYRISLRSLHLQEKPCRGPAKEIRRGLFRSRRSFGQLIRGSETVLGNGLPRTAESAVGEEISDMEPRCKPIIRLGLEWAVAGSTASDKVDERSPAC
jgi:hypothetical protein